MKLEFTLDSYVERIKNSDSYFHTFIDKDNLAVGVLVLGPGDTDTQTPHDSDEVYYVISGDGFLRIRDRDHKIAKSKLYFVKQGVEHFFHGNSEELVVLYFFERITLSEDIQ